MNTYFQKVEYFVLYAESFQYHQSHKNALSIRGNYFPRDTEKWEPHQRQSTHVDIVGHTKDKVLTWIQWHRKVEKFCSNLQWQAVYLFCRYYFDILHLLCRPIQLVKSRCSSFLIIMDIKFSMQPELYFIYSGFMNLMQIAHFMFAILSSNPLGFTYTFLL